MTDIENKLFEYGVDEDSARIISRAIYRHCKGKQNKLDTFHCKQFAEIITDGFLDKVLSEQENLINSNKQMIRELENEISRLRENKYRLASEAEKIEAKIKQYDNRLIGDVEKDNALAGAKKAYDWIYERTGDSIQAAKAFDSYLLGGRYTEQEYYGDTEAIDAESIIKECEQLDSEYLYKVRL